MREIKFRAFLRSDQKLASGITLGYEKYPRGIYEVMDLNLASEIVMLWSEKEQTSFEVSLRKVELLQYTGFKDKNGKEIYDGYIVREKYGVEIPMVVTWDDAGFRTLGKHNGEQYVGYVKDSCEVVGNIYENPELLGRKNEK